MQQMTVRCLYPCFEWGVCKWYATDKDMKHHRQDSLECAPFLVLLWAHCSVHKRQEIFVWAILIRVRLCRVLAYNSCGFQILSYLNCFMIWLDDFNYKLVKDIVRSILEWFPKPKRVNVIRGATVGRLGAFAPLTVLKVSHSIHKFLEILKIRPSEIFPKIQVFPLPSTRNTICLWLVKVP